MTRFGAWGTLLLTIVMFGLTACASMSSNEPAPSPSLYRRLGGREGIAGVVDVFVTNALADPRIGPAFKALPAAKVGPLKSNIADFLCENTGGPCSYLGRTMKESHKGLSLTKEDFDACNAAGRSSAAVLGDHNLVGVMGAHGATEHWPGDGVLDDDVVRDGHGYAANA